MERIRLHDLEPSRRAGPRRGAWRAARLVCFPTDTVYGVGGPLTGEVAAALVAAKGRDAGKPLQVIFSSLQRLEHDVPLTGELRAACRALLPGPVTLVVPYPAGWEVPAPGRVEPAPDGQTPHVLTLGVRVPAWPHAARVLGALELPLLASSANPSGAPPAASVDDVDGALLAACELVLDAGRVGGAASSVVDLSTYAATGEWRLLRAGAWDEGEIATRLARAGRGHS